MVNIVIAGHNDFPCPVGWTVAQAEERIRSRYGLINGGIDRNGEAMAATDTITADGNYQFVNFQSQQGVVTHPPSSGSAQVAAHPAPQLLPPPPPVEEDRTIYIVQLKVYRIDGAKSSLSTYHGFRNYVQAECSGMGLQGYVWRVPNVHGKILAQGTRAQLHSLLDFVRRLKHYGFIQSFRPEKADFPVLTDTFDILPSSRRHVETGLFSDEALDEVVSTASSDLPMLRRTPSPHSLD
eukprot:gene14943-16633_t